MPGEVEPAKHAASCLIQDGKRPVAAADDDAIPRRRRSALHLAAYVRSPADFAGVDIKGIEAVYHVTDETQAQGVVDRDGRIDGRVEWDSQAFRAAGQVQRVNVAIDGAKQDAIPAI